MYCVHVLFDEGNELMPSAPAPIVVGANAGILDLLAAAGRYLVVIIGAVPLLLQLLGARDFAAIIAYFQSADGSALIAAVGALIALGYGLFKTHKRGAEVAAVAANPKVPDSVAQIK